MWQVRESFELHRSCGFRVVVRPRPGQTGPSELLNVHRTLVVGQAQSWCWWSVRGKARSPEGEDVESEHSVCCTK